jgi:hypothetical protein
MTDTPPRSPRNEVTEEEAEGILWPRTQTGKRLVDDYYAHDDAREGVGLSLGARIADIEAEERRHVIEQIRNDPRLAECGPDLVIFDAVLNRAERLSVDSSTPEQER